ncbi:response regulator transcription factor [Gammaproteobacteria bacterium AB-CW1]|uniref:Response regulator transcription factor n=1 Tax=Natronospira elongata TaxID=3110268 RepID=A0AAP6MLP7_9GAMM|nr:response regulator transcription factor [Gammaproteobacteria bacterium AB-CW1]
METIRLLLADDHSIVREGLVSLLEQHEGYQVVAQAADGVEAVEQALANRPDVAIIDLSMPGLHGMEVVRRIHAELPDTRILVLTHHDEEEYVLPLIQAGASGYLVKDSAGEELRRAVDALSRGQAYFGAHAAKVLAEQQRNPHRSAEDPYGSLTDREREVLHLVCEGLTTKEIARRLDIGVKTAENHRGRVLDKLGLANTAELVRYAAKRGLIS